MANLSDSSERAVFALVSSKTCMLSLFANISTQIRFQTFQTLIRGALCRPPVVHPKYVYHVLLELRISKQVILCKRWFHLFFIIVH